MKKILFTLGFVLFSSGLAFANQDFEKANVAFEQNEFDKAYILLKSSLNDTPSHLPSKILMGKVLAISAYYDDAILEFEDALFMGADSNLLIEFYANSLLVTQNYAKLYTLSFSNLSPKNSALLLSIQAKAKQRDGEFATATQMFERALSLHSSNPAVLDAYAKFLVSQNDIEKAQELLNRALQRDPDFAEALRTQATVLKRQNNSEQALTVLKKAYALDPEQPLILRELATTYVSMNEFKDAQEVVNKILEQTPLDALALFLDSIIQKKLNNAEGAEESLSKILNQLSLMEDSNTEVQPSLQYIGAIANLATGNSESARLKLERLMEQGFKTGETGPLLAELYVSQGLYLSAADVYSKIDSSVLVKNGVALDVCEIYIKANKHHKCLQLIEFAKGKDIERVVLLQMEANLLLARKKVSDAFALVNKPENKSILPALEYVLVALEAGQLDSAEQHLLIALEKSDLSDKKINDIRKVSALIDTRKGLYSKALETYKKLHASNKNDLSVILNLASTEASMNNFDAAKKWLDSIPASSPLDYQSQELLASIEERMGNFVAAIEILERLQKFSPSDELATKLARNLYRNGEYDRAIKIIDPIVSKSFLNSDLLALRASIYTAKQDYKNAVEDLNILFNLASEDANMLFDLALMQKSARDFAGAQRSLLRSLALKPSLLPSKLELTSIYLTTGQLKEAKSLINELSRTEKQNPDVLLLQGNISVVEQQLESAMDYYIAAIQVEPNFERALVNAYGVASRGVAIAKFQKTINGILSQNPQHALAAHLLGDVMLNNGDYEKAKDAYEVASNVESYSRLPLVLNNLANVELELGEQQSALTFAERAYALTQNNSAITDTLGWIKAQNGEYTAALDYLRQAYALNAQDPNNRYHIAFTLNKLGRAQEAKRELRIILDEFEGFEKRALAAELYKQL